MCPVVGSPFPDVHAMCGVTPKKKIEIVIKLHAEVLGEYMIFLCARQNVEEARHAVACMGKSIWRMPTVLLH